MESTRYTVLLVVLSNLLENSAVPYEPARWEVRWAPGSSDELEKSKESLIQYTKQLETVGNTLAAYWSNLLGVENQKDVRCIIQDFLLRHSHIGSLATALVKDAPEDRTRDKIRAKIFGEGEQADDNFDALTTLATLTKHPELPGKALLDLRYHQTVRSIGSVAVHFEKRGNDIIPVFTPNEDHPRTAAGQPLYTLALCHQCAMPYLRAYLNVENLFNDSMQEFPVKLARHKTDEYAYGMIFSWLPAQDEDGDDGGEAIGDEAGQNRLFLDYVRGEITDEESDDTIPLYLHENMDSTDDNAHTCPACKAGAQLGYSPVGDYKTGSDIARYVLISTLAAHADEDIIKNPNCIAGGRRLLVFSDSRQGAAKLAANFEYFCANDLIMQGITKCVTRQDEEIPPERLEFFADFIRQKPQGLTLPDEAKGISSYEEWLKNLPAIVLEYIPEDARRNAYEKEQAKAYVQIKADCAGSIQYILPHLKREIEQAGAQSLLRMEYRNQYTRTLMPYSEVAATTLLALSVLRKNKRSEAIRSGELLLRSHRYAAMKASQSKTYIHYIAMCGGEAYTEEADTLFHSFLTWLYLRAMVDCSRLGPGLNLEAEWVYDPTTQDNGQSDSPYRAIDGYDQYAKRPVCKQNQTAAIPIPAIIVTGGGRSLPAQSFLSKCIKGMKERIGLADLNDKDCAEALFQVLVDETEIASEKVSPIIIRQGDFYTLNLEDMRYFKNPSHQTRPGGTDMYFRAEEHTAQLSSLGGQLYQRQFMDGLINILSCSTTFEMGVDLGNLNCVFMANMPPTTANYKQRAGRAGRRSGSTSYVLTYLGDNAHDSYYKDHPADLFFGKIHQPQIYLENTTFRAKHLRAEALHTLLAQLPKSAWVNNEAFFSLGRTLQERLGNFIGSKPHADLQSACNKLAASTGEERKLGYDVLLDLLYQCFNTETLEKFVPKEYMQQMLASPFAQKETFRMYAGPHNPTSDSYWDAPAQTRYERDGSLHARREDLYTSMPKWGVLPRYGFPCNLISLIVPGNSKLKLVRDAKIGIYEYAPGQTVTADKYVYKSEYVDFASPRKEAETKLWQCPVCGCYTRVSPQEKSSCNCGAPMESAKAMTFCIPEAFRSEPGKRARSLSYNEPKPRATIYEAQEEPGEFLTVGTTRLVSCSSNTGELLYICNSPCKKYSAQSRRQEKYDGAIHIVRTEIALWKAAPTSTLPDIFLYNPRRRYHAYNSALQAILRATAIELGVNERDVGGMLHGQADDLRFVLYDDSANGAGTIMKLFMNTKQSEELNNQAQALTTAILRRALNLCKNCTCHIPAPMDIQDPIPYMAYLEDEGDGRPYTACYKCLKSYRNQAFHETLDATDAALLLTHLLGDAAEAVIPSEPAPGQAAEQDPPEPAAASAPPIQTADRDRRKRRQQELRNMLCGGVPAGQCFTILRDGAETEVEFVRCYSTYLRFKTPQGEDLDIDFQQYLNS